MVNVAVAGGTGGVGRTILDILSTTDKHQAFVLSRKYIENDNNVLQVDYNDIDQLVAVLETKNIHTVICCFAVEGSSLADSQLNLIQAAARSKATRRFVPTAYAIPYPQEALQVLPQLKDYFNAIELLKESGLQWTVFLNGIFLDYFGPPELKSHLKPNVFVLDMKNRVAAIPGNGNVPVSFTYSYDLARFVVAALDLEEWQEESRVVGDTLTWHEFVALAEEIRGQCLYP
ncbi:NmrA-like family protein [Aspergillus fischeri NRRL 181]|uniref:NmrA-like family protein n=1 Tax=Neosartorya fischeri (strain ATCC 1020 / DSM 3700 / CBS 544.65 / FGSC A1164 / JCM 1740 / NRRL 181 / WB 181) TaxID=331117 RepID=A1D0M0_NEOFI|nr:NmrA-like family protein [Aspergillus fischeri NRRL 181]EAW24540.1 NmrA-like family protein [Aspergillus fischeri NRRL 181]